MKYSIKLLAIGIAILISAGIASCKKDKDDDTKPSATITNFYANLKGSNEVPPNSSTASGSVTGSYNKDTKILTVTVTYSGMTANGGHIHKGAAGISGAVVFPFTSTTSPITFTSTALDATQEADLFANNYYINLHSTTYPNGEIRGQLFQDNIVSFNADLKGANEVPPNSSTATGSVLAAYNKDTKILTVTTTYSGLTVSAGHVHKGDAGFAGPVVFSFNVSASPIVYTTTSALDGTQESDLMAGHYYVNLHSAGFPDGEIRGQLIKN